MKHFLLQLGLTISIAWIAHLFLPWWIAFVVAFLAAMAVGKKAGVVFGSGFLSIFCLWGIASLWISIQNDFILVERMAELVSVDRPIVLIIITAVVGGLLSGFSALTGFYLKTIQTEN